MKKAIKIIFGILEAALITAVVLFFFVPAAAAFLAPFYKYLAMALILLTVYWVVVICVALFRKEIGFTKEGKIKYKKDKERKVDTIIESDSLEVYSNFERAEFTSKIKDSYQKEIYAFPANMPKEAVIPATKEEVAKSEQPEIKVVSKSKELKKPVSVPAPTPVVAEPKAPKKVVSLSKSKVINFPLWENNTVKVSEGWLEFLKYETKKDGVEASLNEIKKAYEDEGNIIYPSAENVFKPFELTDLNNVRVVILGKLPYYRKNQADGLAYSTAEGADLNQQTEVIIKECIDDVKIKQPKTGSLVNWAKEGVLLLNTTLTAPSNKPALHTDLWKEFTTDVIKELVKDKSPKVFILWGEFAKEYLPLLEKNPKILTLEAASPSPLSAQSGFYGSKPFSKANKFLEENGYKKIDWQL